MLLPTGSAYAAEETGTVANSGISAAADTSSTQPYAASAASVASSASAASAASTSSASSGSTARMNRTLVRVGWYTSALFQEGGADGTPKSGYGYTYLRKLADYAGWDYEYVYGEWPELYEMLQEGKIDVLAGVSATEERRQTMLFPSTAMGSDKYYLYKRSDDNSISITHITTFIGKKIGVIEHNRMSELAMEWAGKNDIDVEFVYYDGISAMDAALESGEVDLVPRTLDSSAEAVGITPVVKDRKSVV